MSYTIVKNIVETKLNKFAEENNIDNIDKAFMYFVYAIYNNKDYNEIDIADIVSTQDIVDGSQDKQIDVIFIDEDDINKEVIIKIFQIKKTYGFSSNTIIQMKNGIEWVFEKTNDQLIKNTNAVFVSKINEIRDVMGEYPLSHIDFEVYFVTLGNKYDLRKDDEYYQELETLEIKCKNIGFRSFEFYTEGAKEVLEKLELIETKGQKISKSLNILYDVNKSSLIEMETEKFKSVICSVKADEIAKLVAEDKNDVLFDKNIRKYLEIRGKVNQSILETCSNEKDSKLFWCLNNGITIICDEFEIKRIPGKQTIDVKNIQIINGCQTSVTLCSAMEEGILQPHTEVLVKVFATTDNDMIDKITVATNNQNPINLRDLKSNDEFQIYYQSFILDKYGYYYERKRNEYKSLPRDGRKKIIVNEKLGQAYLAIGLKKPHQSLGSKGDIFKDEFDNIFKKSTVQKLMFSYLVYQYIEKNKKEVDTSILSQTRLGIVLYGSFHISRVVATLILGQENFPQTQNLDAYISGLLNNNMAMNLWNYYNKTIDAIEKDIGINSINSNSIINFLKRKESSERMNKISESLLLQL